MNAISLILTLAVTIILLLFIELKSRSRGKPVEEAATVRKKPERKKRKSRKVNNNIEKDTSINDPDVSLSRNDSLLALLSPQLSSETMEEDGWIEVKKKKKPSDLNLSLPQGVPTELTKKQRENQKKSQKIKEIKDRQRLEQEERLRIHRLSQSK